MRKNVALKVCAVLAFATCMSVGVATVNGAAETAAPQMTCVGASTKIVSDLKDSGLAFKYSLNTELFANTTANEVAFNEGVSAGVIVCPNELIPANFNVADEQTYGSTVKKAEIEAGYWGLNADETAMEGIVYLYNIPDLDYDTEVTAIGYVTVDGATTYTEPTVRTMAYVAQEALADTSEEWTEDQEGILDGFLTLKPWFSATDNVGAKVMTKSDFFTEVAANSETAADENKVTISDADKQLINDTFGDFVYATTAGRRIYGPRLQFSRTYIDTVFADPTVEEFRFEIYSNNGIYDYRMCWGNWGGDEIKQWNIKSAGGINHIRITRADYEEYVAKARIGKNPNTPDGDDPFGLKMYMKESDGTHTYNTVLVVGNFRTWSWNLEELTVDFEDGKNPVIVEPRTAYEDYNIYYKSAVQKLADIEEFSGVDGADNPDFGSYGYATLAPSVLRWGEITISRVYLDDVFTNANVTAVSFDILSNKAIQRMWVWNNTWGEGDSMRVGSWSITPSGCISSDTSHDFRKGTCQITRDLYNALKVGADLSLELVGTAGDDYVGSANSMIYFDNFTPVLAE